jgi:hypothetical protein
MLSVDNPNFGPKMKQAVLTFQARNVDSQGTPLKTDGEIGSVAWEILFGPDSVPVSTETSDELLVLTLNIARAEEAALVREVRPPANRGPRVDQYQTRTGLRLRPRCRRIRLVRLLPLLVLRRSCQANWPKETR